jgi:hypothetical protein
MTRRPALPFAFKLAGLSACLLGPLAALLLGLATPAAAQ